MTKPKSDFEKWFIEQHGHRTGWVPGTDKQLEARIAVGKSAEAEMQGRKLWDEKRQSALYAWSAKIYGADK